MANKYFRTFQEQYYDGDVDYCDERYVSPEMKQGTNDCVEYIEEVIDNEAVWLMKANSGRFYREPYKSEKLSEVTPIK
ncbi:hypothetical protein [Paenibacillus sp. XY044]|uniref:hypothetical protein n=1 Tax=Paenibacillus sp. XY044 TaxID=2026089 RepID=UPI000B98569F|nr:hypothetical protein [Paenibacillus sp. XY044]OZB98038.1 hypothetical protein CJP46_02410 [Paenibacillus sp. XY044]